VSPNASTSIDVFRAIGDARRRRILELLAVSTRSVGELAAELGIAQPSVTQHLAALSAAGLVESSKDGNRSMYRMRAGGLDAVVAWIRSIAD